MPTRWMRRGAGPAATIESARDGRHQLRRDRSRHPDPKETQSRMESMDSRKMTNLDATIRRRRPEGSRRTRNPDRLRFHCVLPYGVARAPGRRAHQEPSIPTSRPSLSLDNAIQEGDHDFRGVLCSGFRTENPRERRDRDALPGEFVIDSAGSFGWWHPATGSAVTI